MKFSLVSISATLLLVLAAVDQSSAFSVSFGTNYKRSVALFDSAAEVGKNIGESLDDLANSDTGKKIKDAAHDGAEKIKESASSTAEKVKDFIKEKANDL
jgi:hypothetical protein